MPHTNTLLNKSWHFLTLSKTPSQQEILVASDVFILQVFIYFPDVEFISYMPDGAVKFLKSDSSVFEVDPSFVQETSKRLVAHFNEMRTDNYQAQSSITASRKHISNLSPRRSALMAAKPLAEKYCLQTDIPPSADLNRSIRLAL